MSEARSVGLARFDRVHLDLGRLALLLESSYPFLRLVACRNLDLPHARTRRAGAIQHRAEDFIPCLRNALDLAGCDFMVGLTDLDLYVPELNFVFGLASPQDRVAVVSTHRLEPSFYGLAGDERVLLVRTATESVHELGHLLGLPHCADRRCVMFFSNSILDTDAKGYSMCPRCRAKASCLRTGPTADRS